MPVNTMSDSNVATIRTTVSALVIFGLAWVVSKVTGHEVDTEDPTIIIIGAAVFGVMHRLFTVLSEKIPYLGYVLFGVNRSPQYTTPPPAVPALANEDKGQLSFQDMIVVTAIAVLVAVVLYFIIT